MSVIAQQFGKPQGLMGRLAGKFMERNNGDLNRWAVRQLTDHVDEPHRIIELGPGPGVGLLELAHAFPSADVIGIDPSAEMCRRALRRTAGEADGRVQVVRGDLSTASTFAPVNLVLAVHVLYFWHEPRRQAQQLRDLLADGGVLALGYQLREHMPAPARKSFPREGHRLYDTDRDVIAMLGPAGMDVADVEILGDPSQPAGRLLVALRRTSED